MTINAAALLDFSIADKRHAYTAKDLAFYALSVGMGQTPSCEEALRFVDYRRDLAPLPSYALIMGYPGFWLGEKETVAKTGVDPKRILHVEQQVQLFAPIPVPGDVTGKTRVTGLLDKGRGKAVLLQSERRITDTRSGATIAICRQVHYLAGQGGFGVSTMTATAPASAPRSNPDIVSDLQTRPEQALLYRFNGDENPLHLDPALAQKAGFPHPILHGMCTIGVAVHALVRHVCDYDPGKLTGFSVRMKNPVYPGETLGVEIWRNGFFRLLVKDRDVVALEGGRFSLAS